MYEVNLVVGTHTHIKAAENYGTKISGRDSGKQSHYSSFFLPFFTAKFSSANIHVDAFVI